MAMTYTESGSGFANFGGFADVIGGIAAVVLAVVALAGLDAGVMTAIATVILGAAFLVQGSEILAEFSNVSIPPGALTRSGHEFGSSNITAVFLVGATGVVLGVLALVGIHAGTLTAIAIIAFGSAMVLSSSAIWHLHLLKQSSVSATRNAEDWQTGGDILANEMASGSAGVQALAGLGSVVLGVLAVIGINPQVLILAAVLVMGATIILNGSTASGAVLSMLGSSSPRARNS